MKLAKEFQKTRDVLIHDYEGVDALMVWDTIQKSILELIENLKKVV